LPGRQGVTGSNPVFSTNIFNKNTQAVSVWVFLFMTVMFYTYILYSKTLNKYYIGSCQNIEQRLQDHLNSRSKFTKIAKDWEVHYFETFTTRSEAYQREMQIKKMKSRKYIETLING
jgi:putative endonuclease